MITPKHLSSQFDSELSKISNQILELGGIVEDQLKISLTLLSTLDLEKFNEVLRYEEQINSMEVLVDKEIVSMIARRQPTAKDLRLLIAISKTTNNLERVGDEATKIGKMSQNIMNHANNALKGNDLKLMAELALDMLKSSLDAFARLDIKAAIHIMKRDDEIDIEFDGYTRKLITYMMEDPKMISVCLDLIFIAKALERIGDHAKNIAEQIIFIVKGEDVRHTSLSEIELLTE